MKIRNDLKTKCLQLQDLRSRRGKMLKELKILEMKFNNGAKYKPTKEELDNAGNNNFSV